MSEVLDQSQIEVLLNAAAESDEMPVVQPAPEELVGFNADATTIYDFKRPERVSKDQIRALAAIHDSFARNFSATLSGFLRTIIEVRLTGVEQLTYSEFIHSLPNPTCFVILQGTPLEGQMCLEISPLIVYPIIDRLLGGNNAGVFIPQRPLTAIEWRLINRLVDRALEHLSEAWRNLLEAHFEVAETESNPQLVHIVAPTEVVVFVTFEIKMGQSAGTMSMCIPFNVIESVLSKLATRSWFGYRSKSANGAQQQRLTRNLTKSTVQLTAYLGQTTIKLSELLALRPGDILALDKRATRDLLIQVEGRTRFAGTPGQSRGHRAVRVRRQAEIDEPL